MRIGRFGVTNSRKESEARKKGRPTPNDARLRVSMRGGTESPAYCLPVGPRGWTLNHENPAERLAPQS